MQSTPEWRLPGGQAEHIARVPDGRAVYPHPSPLLAAVMGERLALLDLLASGFQAGSTIQISDPPLLLVVADDDPTPSLEVATRGRLVRGIDQSEELLFRYRMRM